MRLAQIARKVGLTPVDIKRFLESEFDQSIGNEPNYKLDKDQIDAVLEKFPIPIPKVEKPVIKEAPVEVVDEFDEAVSEMEKVVEAVNDVEAEVSTIENETAEEAVETVIEENTVEASTVEEPIAEEITEITEPVAEVVENDEAIAEVEINYDEPSEVLDADAGFVEVAVDREADLIKAPKIKLDGLKVLGKIELPGKKEEEVVEKTEEEVEQEEADTLAELDAAMQLNAQDIKPAKVTRKESKETKEHFSAEEESYSEYKDARGIYHFSLQQKQNREKALVQVELNRQREAAKEKKKRHYQETMKDRKQSEPETISKSKQNKIEIKKQKREEKKIEPPKGLWAKFKRWLND